MALCGIFGHFDSFFSNNPTNGIKEKYEVKQFGIKTDREILHERIKARLHEMIDNGLIEETENILKDFKTSIGSSFVPTSKPQNKKKNISKTDLGKNFGAEVPPVSISIALHNVIHNALAMKVSL